MTLLALDTSTQVGGAALLNDHHLVGAIVLNIEATHAERLMSSISGLIESTGSEQPDAIAVVVGPGSFTGLRIGVVSAKALAYAWGVPLVAVDGLEALAWQVAARDRLIVPAVDARRKHVYGALFAGSEAGPPQRLAASAYQPLEALLEEAIERSEERPIAFVGDAGLRHAEAVSERLGAQLDWVAPGERLLHPPSVAALGAARLEAGELADPMQLLPAYLKESEAEAKWRTKSRS